MSRFAGRYSNWIAVGPCLLAGCAAVGSTALPSTGAGTSGTRVAGTPPPDVTTTLATQSGPTDDVVDGIEIGVPLDEPGDPGADSLSAWALQPPGQGPIWGKGTGKSYLIPAADIVGFLFLLNQFNRHFNAEDVYGSNWSTITHNLGHGWIVDNDPFATNQFLHPYQGSLYHGFARSAGLNYWEALGYDVAGSALWEIAGETGPPSINDQITTSFGGSFLGEALFRMSSHVLELGGEQPGFFRSLAAGLISPSAGFNRLAFGERFDGVFPSRDPAIYTRVGIGARRNEKEEELGALRTEPQDEIVADFVMDYGLPGKTTYEYKRPFDYFHFEVSAVSTTNSLPEDLMIRGLLAGSDYNWGHSYRGIWGLYGGFDYISPEVFSVSSTSLSVGTTGQWWLSDSVSVQETLLGGLGWTAAGTIAEADVDRNYHYGVSPQGLVALRILFGNVAVLDYTGRDYYLGSLETGGRENSETILRSKVALTVRVYGRHAIGLQYVASSRDARFADSPDTNQSIGAVSLFYTYISDKEFGAVEWR